MAYKKILMGCALTLLLSGCGWGKSADCSYFGNCGCTDWYNDCSLH